MSGLPERARVVIIGAGIVGNSMAWHLARLGWRDIVLLDKGTLPNPGGSTGHASNFIFLTDHSKEMTALTLDSVVQYKEMGVFTRSGGIEVARTPERMEELKRRTTSSISWGIDTELLTPAQIKEQVPYIEDSVILGGFSTPGRRRRRLAAGRHDHARARAGARCPDDLRRHRGHRHRCRGRPRPGGPHGQGHHRSRHGRHRVWLLEPADRRRWPAPTSR